MGKQEIIKTIESRIKIEYKKYGNDPNIDFAAIAARKIYSSLTDLKILNGEIRESEESDCAHKFLADGDSCVHCGKTISELLEIKQNDTERT